MAHSPDHHDHHHSAQPERKENNPLDGIAFITIPSSVKLEADGFSLDSRKAIPVLLPEGKQQVSSEGVDIQDIIAGMLKILAWQPAHQDSSYFRDFLLALQPNIAQELNMAAIAKTKKKDFSFAEELFLAVRYLAPLPASFLNLANLYKDMSRDFSAKKDETSADVYEEKYLRTLTDGLKIFPEQPHLLSELGSFHVEQGNLENARDYLERYLAATKDEEKKAKASDDGQEAGPNKAMVRKTLNEIESMMDNERLLTESWDFMNMGDEEKALERADAFIKKNPKVWNGWFLKGWAHRRLEQFEEGQKAFLTILELGEQNASVYNELAICARETGSRDLAKDYLGIALDLEEENVPIMANLAFMHLDDENFNEARVLLEKARRIDPQDPGVIQLMSDYERRTGEKLSSVIHELPMSTEAIEHLEKHPDAYSSHEHGHHNHEFHHHEHEE
ncbi:tetratricopeptide repeat protein [Parasphaerochaeta coccoides]|uniref:Tetratricopeptide TPR_1 repeat-containing protein n=1 Tax=Parasphaerochaeta coccoides (strain ATCC BAA-1237 / DSM 17374 / SPN1) TaxID=760011 RepID=F4GIM1_PARC1|nr:tetratricopeptide repeat protein [Parasphaerochaeta coccoides]AEC02155.1 Tetratricopeptide TPR_1 repeat-containing protein [Parasphaerochaeta coccoides DSM 17374]